LLELVKGFRMTSDEAPLPALNLIQRRWGGGMRYALPALPRRRLLWPVLALGGLLFLSALSGCLNSADKPDSARAPKPDTAKVVQLDSAPPQPLRDIIKPGTGKLEGQVFDAETGQGIPYCQVLIKGMRISTVAESTGVYLIINIPPGKYTVWAQNVGYIKDTKKNVKVRPDITTAIDFKMKNKYPNIDPTIRWDLKAPPHERGKRH